jgi:hypothetical protein
VNAVAPLRPSPIVLPRYEDMCRAIAECHAVDEAKEFLDKAEALRAYSHQLNNREAEVQFAEIKLRAQRRCGELLGDLARSGHRQAPSTAKKPGLPSLKDLGFSKGHARACQLAAVIPGPVFEAHLAHRRASGKPTTWRSATRAASGRNVGVTEFREAFNALEALSNVSLQPQDFVRRCPADERDRLRLAVSCAAPWVVRLHEAVSTQVSMCG